MEVTPLLTALEAWRRKAFQGPGVAEVTNKQVARVDQPTTGSENEPGGGNEELPRACAVSRAVVRMSSWAVTG